MIQSNFAGYFNIGRLNFLGEIHGRVDRDHVRSLLLKTHIVTLDQCKFSTSFRLENDGTVAGFAMKFHCPGLSNISRDRSVINNSTSRTSLRFSRPVFHGIR